MNHTTHTTVTASSRIPMFHQSLISIAEGKWGWGKHCPFCPGGVILMGGQYKYEQGHCIQCGTDVLFLDVATNTDFPSYLTPPFAIPTQPLHLPVHTVELVRHKHTVETYGFEGKTPFVLLRDPESDVLENVTFPGFSGYDLFSVMAKRDSVNIVFQRFPVAVR